MVLGALLEWKKIPHAILPLNCSFGIGYGIGQKYLPIWVTVSGLNQNCGFGCTLLEEATGVLKANL